MGEYEQMAKATMNITIVGDQVVDQGTKAKERTIDFQDMLNQAAVMTQGKHLQYGTKMLEFGKRKDQFFKGGENPTQQ